MKCIEAVLSRLTDSLRASGVDEARVEAEVMVATLLKTSRTKLLLDRNTSWPKTQNRRLNRWMTLRQKGLPFAYIAGEQPFADLTLRVNRHVLIPRPETEMLAEVASGVLNRFRTPVTVVDVGTGSGNIALSLAGHPNCRKMIGIDLSKAALAVARKNARQLKKASIVQWRHGNLLAPLRREDRPIGLITANLPYIPTSVIPTLQRELRWEPILALDGGFDGLRAIMPCVGEASKCLMPGGTLILEIGFDQDLAVVSVLKTSGTWDHIEVIKDYARLPRIVKADRKDF